MVRIRVPDHEQAASLCSFLLAASVHAERTSDPRLLLAQVPGGPSLEHERRELRGYVETWRRLNPGVSAELVD